MEETLLKILPQLSIGVVALIVLGGTIYVSSRFIGGLIATFRNELDEARREREKNNSVFMEFVQSNNHKVTELVEASTRAVVEGSEAIRQSSVYIGKATEALTIYNERARR